MPKMTNKERCKNCIHKRVCPHPYYYEDLDGIERCKQYKPKKKKGVKK